MNHINKFGEDMYESAICTELAVHRKVTEVLCDSCPYLLPLLDVYHDVDSTTMVLPGLMPDLLTVCMQRKFSEDEASEVVRQLAEALAALHAIGIAHCDVKPENLALCPRRGHMVLFDFGLALTDVAPPRVVAGKVRGTVAFLSPEVLRDHVYGSAADMWALGAVLYVMLTQSYPFRDPRATCQVRYNIDNVRQCSGGGGQERDQCSSELLHLLEALFVVDPARRASAHDVLAHPWLGQGGGGGRVEGRGSACEVEVEVEGMQDTNCLAA
jgi:serine/threonine protein kinase